MHDVARMKMADGGREVVQHTARVSLRVAACARNSVKQVTALETQKCVRGKTLTLQSNYYSFLQFVLGKMENDEITITFGVLL